jgi:hypothetical protein
VTDPMISTRTRTRTTRLRSGDDSSLARLGSARLGWLTATPRAPPPPPPPCGLQRDEHAALSQRVQATDEQTQSIAAQLKAGGVEEAIRR